VLLFCALLSGATRGRLAYNRRRGGKSANPDGPLSAWCEEGPC
jgi:hypothetical protein